MTRLLPVLAKTIGVLAIGAITAALGGGLAYLVAFAIDKLGLDIGFLSTFILPLGLLLGSTVGLRLGTRLLFGRRSAAETAGAAHA